MMMQERPICWGCGEPIETNADIVFEAVCGHDGCPSAVWHGLHLMDWRERRLEVLTRMREHWQEMYEAWKEKNERGI